MKNRVTYECPEATKETCEFGCHVTITRGKDDIKTDEWMPCVRLLKEKDPFAVKETMKFKRVKIEYDPEFYRNCGRCGIWVYDAVGMVFIRGWGYRDDVYLCHACNEIRMWETE